jgi:acyl carrier protein
MTPTEWKILYEIEQLIEEMIVSPLEEGQRLRPETRFIDDLNFDFLDELALLNAVYAKYKVYISDEELKDIVTVHELVGHIILRSVENKLDRRKRLKL